MFQIAFGYVFGRALWTAMPAIIGIIVVAAIMTAMTPTPDADDAKEFADVKAKINQCGFTDAQIRGDFKQGIDWYKSVNPDPWGENSEHLSDSIDAKSDLTQARLHESGVAEAEARLAAAQQRDREHEAYMDKYGICYDALLDAGVMAEKRAEQNKPIPKFVEAKQP
jgi:hypothetical protein